MEPGRDAMWKKLQKFRSRIGDQDFLLKLFLSFGILFAGFLMLVHVFFVNLNIVVKEEAVAQCGERFRKDTEELNDTFQNIYRNGIALLQDDLVALNVKDYEELTIENRMALPNVLQLLANLTVREKSVLHAYLFADDKKVFLESGIYDTEAFFGQFHKYLSLDLRGAVEEGLKTDAMLLLMPTKLQKLNKSSLVMPMVFARQGSSIVLVQDIELLEIGNIVSGHSESYQDFFITCSDRVIYQSSNEAKELSWYLSPSFTEEKGVVFQESILYDMKVYCIIDFEALEQEISQKYQHVTNLYALFFIVIFFLIVWMSLRLYNPILNLKKIILNENRKLLESYHKTNLEKMVFYNQYPVSEAEREKLLESLSFKGWLCCAMVEIIPEKAEHNPLLEFDNSQKFMFEETIRYLLEDILRKALNAYVISRNYLSYVVVMGEDEISESRIQEAFSGVRNIFQHDYSYCRIKVGMGERTKNIHEIQKSYFLAETMAELYDKDTKFQFFACRKDQITYSMSLDKEKLTKIENVIRTGNEKALKDILGQWQEEMREKTVLVQEQKQFWYTVFRRMCRLAREERVDFHEITGLEEDCFAFGSRNAAEGLGRYTEYVGRAAEGLCGYYRLRSVNVKARMNEIIGYIHENYQKNIGLTEIADHFGLSPHYMSRVFKAYMNVNLSVYVAEYRIAIAKNLLISTDKPIGLIAEEVGLPSKATFLRVFKSIAGVSPTEFRRINKDVAP